MTYLAISLESCSEIVRRIGELERMEGNCGRAYRRFLKLLSFGTREKLLSIEFAGYADKALGALEYAHLCAFVEARSQAVAVKLREAGSKLRFNVNVFDQMFNLVGATLSLGDIDIDSATLATLRALVGDIRSVVYLYFGDYSPETVEAFVEEQGLAVTAQEEAALGTHALGGLSEHATMTSGAASLLQYFEVVRPAQSYLTEALKMAV